MNVMYARKIQMELLSKLIEEIEAAPLTTSCSTCLGQGKVPSPQKLTFFKIYGQNSLEVDSVFHTAEQAWLKAGKPSGDKMETLFLDIGLSTKEAKNFHSLYLTQKDPECDDCKGGRALTEHGKLVAKLRDALVDL